MKKKTMVSMVASSLLLAPFILNQVVEADENLPELSPAKEVVTQVAPEPVASEGVASQSQADQTASVQSVDQKNEVSTSKPVIASPMEPAETERVDKQVGQDKALTIVEKTNIPQAPQGTGDQASPAASTGAAGTESLFRILSADAGGDSLSISFLRPEVCGIPDKPK